MHVKAVKKFYLPEKPRTVLIPGKIHKVPDGIRPEYLRAVRRGTVKECPAPIVPSKKGNKTTGKKPEVNKQKRGK